MEVDALGDTQADVLAEALVYTLADRPEEVEHKKLRGQLHETGTNSDRYESVSLSIHFFSYVYMGPA